MTNHMETARQLRARTDVHFNCCQSVLVSFAADLGLTEEQAFALGSNFGAGMRMGSACGALTGALMALGLMGCDEKKAAELLRRFRTDHGATDCAALLRASDWSTRWSGRWRSWRGSDLQSSPVIARRPEGPTRRSVTPVPWPHVNRNFIKNSCKKLTPLCVYITGE